MSKVKQDEHLEDRVQVAVSELRGNLPIPCDLYLLHREVLRGIFLYEQENILVDKEVARVLNDYKLLNLFNKEKEK